MDNVPSDAPQGNKEREHTAQANGQVPQDEHQRIVDDVLGGILREKPRIVISGDLALMTDAAREALVTANDPPVTFRHMEHLTRIGEDDDGRPVIRALRQAGLMHRLADAARWVKLTRDGEDREAHPPAIAAAALLEMADGLAEIPVVSQVAMMPFFAPDGSLVSKPGYSAAARVWYEPVPGVTIPAVPEHPSDAEKARAGGLLLGDLLADFPFAGKADRSHALAFLLLPFIRPMISGPTPLHVIDAPVAGTGKGLLTRACLLPSHGTLPPMTQLSSDEEEVRKQIATVLLAGYPSVVFDNVRVTVDSAALASAIIEQAYRGRLLGRNEDVSATVRCVWSANGNNVQASGEIARRSAWIRLDDSADDKAREHAEHPWQRIGFRHSDLIGWARANLGELAWAALTIIRSWQAAGSKPWEGKPLGSFEEWSRIMGGIIQHADGSGFLANSDDAYDRAASDEGETGAFVRAWAALYGAKPVTPGDLAVLAEMSGDPFELGNRTDRGKSTSMGTQLRRMQDRVFGEWQVKKTGRKWYLEHLMHLMPS
jgi:putative DNA primase/helicase